ncbi:hypothetical protein [Chitinophaga ginsengisoli]|uniref:Uncharacterized protein n=1 Tax=Chitinophaga ginsengisoli TaxID=363837 RepID=A0A2P8FXK1_9BACT|nr:hypothetical protein [Chitinophaga ginsengisoli]PSL26444.1 hypothetical protein CLV42_111158 [Chitinophaga ginsengisoli]
MEEESLIIVLEELTHEQKKQANAASEIVVAVKDLKLQVDQLQEKLLATQSSNDRLDSSIIQRVLKKELLDFKLSIIKQRHNVIHKFQVLLFPEQDHKLFYKVVFGRWFLWIIMMVFLNYSYRFFLKWTDDRKEAIIRQLEVDQYRKAWTIYYRQQSKSKKRQLDSIYYNIAR